MIYAVGFDHIGAELPLLSLLAEFRKVNRKREFRRNAPESRHHALQALRTYHEQRLVALCVSHGEEQTRQPADVIRVVVRKADHIDGTRAPALLPERYLRALPAVNEQRGAVAARHHRREPAIRQRHHAAGSKETNIKHP